MTAVPASRVLLALAGGGNCGTGAGGFAPGNTCGRGGRGESGGAVHAAALAAYHAGRNLYVGTAGIPAEWSEAKVAAATELTGERGEAALPALRRSADLYGAAAAVGQNFGGLSGDRLAAAVGAEHADAAEGAKEWAADHKLLAEYALNQHAAAVAEGLPAGNVLADAGRKAVLSARLVDPAALPAGARAGLSALAARGDRVEASGGLTLVVFPRGSAVRRAVSAIESRNGPPVGQPLSGQGDYARGSEAARLLWDASAAPAGKAPGGRVKPLTQSVALYETDAGEYRLVDAAKTRSKGVALSAAAAQPRSRRLLALSAPALDPAEWGDATADEAAAYDVALADLPAGVVAELSAARPASRVLLSLNCGIGPGGFLPGNQCAKGGYGT